MLLVGNWQINLKKLFLNFNIQNSNEFSSLNEAFNNDIHKNIETFNNFNNNRSYQDLINERSKLSNISDDNIDKNKIISMTDNTSDFDNIENNSIKDIWNSEEYISSRSEFGDKTEITKETICNVCKNQTHSKRLNRVSKSFAIKL